MLHTLFVNPPFAFAISNREWSLLGVKFCVVGNDRWRVMLIWWWSCMPFPVGLACRQPCYWCFSYEAALFGMNWFMCGIFKNRSMHSITSAPPPLSLHPPLFLLLLLLCVCVHVFKCTHMPRHMCGCQKTALATISFLAFFPVQDRVSCKFTAADARLAGPQASVGSPAVSLQ